MGLFDWLFGNKKGVKNDSKEYYASGKLKNTTRIIRRGKNETYKVTTYYENGIVKSQGKFLDLNSGIKDGIWSEWYDDATVKQLITYDKGNIVGKKEFQKKKKKEQVEPKRSGARYFHTSINDNPLQDVMNQVISDKNNSLNKHLNEDNIKKQEKNKYNRDNDLPDRMKIFTGQTIYKKDMSGLLAYFKERKNMERIFNELTHVIRNGKSVKEYLIDIQIIGNEELMHIAEIGFGDVAGFLKNMLEINENKELRKDYNACIEAVKILQENKLIK
tara:strand:+ start:606 stop:1427 length:822 start_codon:yes stop_codon:yes gene_type:complete